MPLKWKSHGFGCSAEDSESAKELAYAAAEDGEGSDEAGETPRGSVVFIDSK